MKIQSVIPTRGLVYARTLQSVYANDLSDPILVSGYPIPESHTQCVVKALKTDCTHILFVEEDMELPDHAVEKMMGHVDYGAEVVVIDYPIREKIRSVIHYEGGQALWCGFGCTLIHRRIFEEVLQKPWFTDKQTVYITHENPIEYYVKYEPDKKTYGGFDIWFGLQLKEHNIPIFVVEGMQCKHLRCTQLEHIEDNHATEEIVEI